jgi:hypothetical protein
MGSTEDHWQDTCRQTRSVVASRGFAHRENTHNRRQPNLYPVHPIHPGKKQKLSFHNMDISSMIV